MNWTFDDVMRRFELTEVDGNHDLYLAAGEPFGPIVPGVALWAEFEVWTTVN